ncbi:MAG: alpha/beta hydrolase [Kiritimatiellae bacterium]|nr:alpha/beta hydrolase [Kiritimatiellia bacterium]
MTWLQGDIVANGVRLHYHRTGGDGPPVVLAHGITDKGLCWCRTARALESTYDCVMVDARGHGQSEAPADGYGPAVHGADFAGLIQGLALGRPAFVGHSMGAGIGIVVAAQNPESVACLVLEDPPVRAAQTQTAPATDRAEQRARAIADRKSVPVSELMANCARNHPRMDEEEIRHWAESKMEVSPHVAKWHPAGQPDWFDLIGRIRCPILLLTGDPAKGAIVTPETAERLAGLWQDGRVVNFPAAGHCIRYNDFDAFIRVVQPFLDSVLGEGR